MTLSIVSSDVTQAIVDVIDAAKNSLGINKVHYGDQVSIPKPPVVIVEGVRAVRNLNETGHTVRNELATEILVFAASVNQPRATRKTAIVLAESVADLFVTPTARNLGGIIVHGYVSEINPGYSRRGDGPLLHTVQLTWIGKSQGRLV